MVKRKKLLASVAFASLTLSLTFGLLPAYATKMQAKPLPRNGDPAGRSSYSRQSKDFSSASNQTSDYTSNADPDQPLAITRWKRRPDYRDVEKQEAEQKEQKAKDAAQAKAQEEAAKKEYYKKQVELSKKRRDEAINYNNQGVLMGQQGRWQEAITNHEKAVEYDPYDKQFRINLSAARTAFGEKKFKEGDSSGAASLFRKALAAQQDNATAAKGLSKALEKLGFDPVDPEVRMNIGDQLLASNDYEGAYIEYLQSLQIEPSGKAYVKVGDMEYRYRRVAQAQYYYQQAIVKDPNCAAAHRQLGMLKLALRDETGGAALLRKAVILDSHDAAAGTALVDLWRAQVAKNPLNADSHLGLAGALQLTGDFVGAESEYKKLELINANYPGLADGRASLAKAYQHARADKHMKAAETLFSQGLRKEALAEISQAVMIEERNAHYQFLLGECLEALGDYAGAHRAYLTCVLIDPENNKEAAARMKEMQSYAASSGQQQSMPAAKMQFTPRLPMAGQAGVMPGQPVNMPAQSGAPASPGVPTNVMPPQQSMMRLMPMQSNMQARPQMGAPAAFAPGPQMQAPAGSDPYRFGAPINRQMPKNMFEGGPGIQQPMAPPQMSSQSFAPPEQQVGSLTSTRNFPASNADSTISNGAMGNDNLNARADNAAALNSQAMNSQAGGISSNSTIDPKMAAVEQAEARRDFMSAANILREVVAANLQDAETHHRLAVNLMGAGLISEAVSEFRIASALRPTEKNYADDLARALEVHKRSLTSKAREENAVGGGNQ